MDYYLTVIIIIGVLLLGLVATFKPFVGILGVILWLFLLLPIALDPTVIVGMGFNSTSGLSYTLTQSIPELRALSILSAVACTVLTAIGMVNNID